MSNPFPGMNPYLEESGIWPDFHSTFIHCWREAIADALPGNYEARIDERVNLVTEDPDELSRVIPDVAVSRYEREASESASGGVATLAPVTIAVPYDEPWRQAYIQILRRPESELVAVLELLSPTNKRPQGRAEYLGKRYDLLQQDVHLLELDLLLGGRRVPLSKPLPTGDYYALLYRSQRRPNCEVYTWTVRDRLPHLPIPLRAPDPDISVDLAPVMQTAFERGRYAKSLKYDAPLDSARNSPNAEWIRKQCH